MQYKLNEAKMFADIAEGTAIVINSLTGIYYGMNEFGTAVFEQLMSSVPVDAIVSAAKALDAAPEDIEDRINAFVESLLSFEILIPAEEAADSAVALDSEVAKTSDFTPQCAEYNDVQELLFADPIHEVDPEEGWTPQ